MVMERPSMVNSPSGGVLTKAARWNLRIQKVAAVEIGFRGAPGCLRGTWTYIGGRSRLVEQRGAHEGGGHAQGVGMPPAPWLPRLFLDAHSKSLGSRLLRKSRSQRFHSIRTSFDIPFM